MAAAPAQMEETFLVEAPKTLWRSRGHALVLAEVLKQGEPDLLLCVKCGASCSKRVSTALRRTCDPGGKGLESHRARLSAGLHPGSDAKLRIGDLRSVDAEHVQLWASRLGASEALEDEQEKRAAQGGVRA